VLQQEIQRARGLKQQADVLADHLSAEPQDAASAARRDRLVDAVHEHVEQGPEVVSSMIPVFFSMISEGRIHPVEEVLPWGGVARVPVPEILSFDDVVELPITTEVSELAELPEMPVAGAEVVAQPAPAAPATAPQIGYSMGPSVELLDLGDLGQGYAQAGYTPEEAAEYEAMYRAAAANQYPDPGSCDQGCSVRR
jgi:hypothetical protein